MKQLTKEQLTEMVHENCKKIIGLNIDGMVERLNIDGMVERVQESIKGSGDNCGDLMVKFVVAYCSEIMNECNQVLSETLYDILYTE